MTISTPKQIINNNSAEMSRLGQLSVGTEQPSIALWPDKSYRYHSEWDSSVVVVDVTQNKTKLPTINRYDLGDISFNLGTNNGMYQGFHKLSEFPQFINAFKVAINEILFKHDRGAPGREIQKFINHATRFVIYLLRMGKYNFNSLTREDTDELFNNLKEKGWLGTLPYEQYLAEVQDLIKSSVEMRDHFCSTASNQGSTARLKNIRAHIGMPLEGQELPTSLSETIVQVTGKKNIRKTEVFLGKPPERRTLNTAMETINLLSLHRGGDSIQFYPFETVEKKLNEIYGTSDGRSKNLCIKDAIKILKAACTWVLDLAAPVTDLALYARALLEADANSVEEDKLKAYEEKIAAKLADFRQTYYKLVRPFWMEGKKASYMLSELVQYVQTSSSLLITFSHALRANEVNGGFGAHYGAYLGCVSQVEGFPEAKQLEMFVSKNLQDYAQFWCGKLVEKCIRTMELLLQACRPAAAAPVDLKETREAQRADKLFIRLRFDHAGYFSPRRPLEFYKGRGAFLRGIGLPSDVLDGERSFRRLFCIIYVHRFDDTSITALSQRLFHFSLKQTEWYYTNGDGQKYADSIEAMFREERLVMKEMELVRQEKFASEIVDYLKGKQFGGGFPALVRKVVKGLASAVEFVSLSLPKKGKIVAEKLLAEGYLPLEHRHGECMMGSSTAHRREVNCTNRGVAHPEDASLHKCTGCVMNQNRPLHIAAYEQDLSELEKGAKNFKVPQVIRLVKAQQAEDLKVLIEANYAIGEKNQVTLTRLLNRWADMTQSEELSPET